MGKTLFGKFMVVALTGVMLMSAIPAFAEEVISEEDESISEELIEDIVQSDENFALDDEEADSLQNENDLVVDLIEGADETLMSCSDGGIAIDEEHFSDANFRAYISENIDTNKDNMLSEDEISSVTEMELDEMGITDLKGIGYFTSLKKLRCNYNELTILDVSECTALTELHCDDNKLTSLDISGCTALTELECDRNELTSLDVSGCTALTYLECDCNKLTSLDVSRCTALQNLLCAKNSLTDLNVSGCTQLYRVYAFENQLTALDISSCPLLVELSCNKNKMTDLDISGCEYLLYAVNNGVREEADGVVGYTYSEDDIAVYDVYADVTTAIEHGHVFGNWEVTKKASAMQEGEKVRVCSVCLKKETEVIPRIVAPASPQTPQQRKGSAETITIGKKPTSVKAKATKKNKVTVSWKKFKKKKKTKATWKKIKKIEIQYSTDKSFSAVNTKCIQVGKSKTKYTLKGLQKNTRYYVRVRYSDDNGGYSKWSSVKKVKTKK